MSFCPFVLFILGIMLPVLLRFMFSDYTIGIVKRFYSHHHDLVIFNRYGISVSQMITDMLYLFVSTSWSFPHSRLITGFVTRSTRRVTLVGQERITLPEHLRSSPVFSGIRVVWSLALCVDRCCPFVLLSFGYCVVCSSVFWLLCCLFFCLLAIVLSVLLSFSHCVVCPSVFWPLCCLSFSELRILIPPFGIFKLFL